MVRVEVPSQSPYGAMWFATGPPSRPGPGVEHSRNPLTRLCGLQPFPPRPSPAKKPPGVAIPLRGYVVCNFIRGFFRFGLPRVAIPLRGYVVCNWESSHSVLTPSLKSQSPYGAMWFATIGAPGGRLRETWSRNPLTGLCGLQR